MKKILVPALSVFALFAMSSCGDDPDASGPPILVLSAANGGGWSESVPAASDMAGADGKMMWGYLQNFTAATDLPALDSNARSYTLSAGDVSTDSLNALKTAFGLTEDFVAQDASQGGGYLSGNYDGTTPTMYVGSDPMHYWSFSPVWDESSISSRPCIMEDAVVPETTVVPTGDDVPASEVATEICAEPVAPENVPTKAEAEELFATTVSALGANVDDLVIDSYADEWGANVNGYLKIDGVRSSLTWSIGYGANGEISWASGVLADVQDGASYPRIGTTAALERLNNQQSDMWGDPMVRSGVAYDATAAIEPATSDVESAVTTEPATSDVPASDVVTETYPVTDAPAPEIQEVSIVGVEEELVTLYGADGSIYLVPGYTFIAAEDEFGYAGRYTVSALPDEYMQVADGVNEVPLSIAPETAAPAVDPAVDPDMSVAQEVADSVVGMSEAEATKTAEAKGLTVRVGSRDGEDFPLTMDYRLDRVTLTVQADKVTAVTVG
jgi:hypothetical protein